MRARQLHAAVIAWFVCGGLADAASSDRSVTFDNLKIHYRSVGSGEAALIFVHGWTCDAEFWRAQMDAFPEHRVLALDLPGHGQSDKPWIDYTIPLFARAIEAVMRDAKVERAVLIGHSMGAPVIREFYRLFPQKTAALVIVDGALRPMFSRERSDRFLAELSANYAPMARRMVDGMSTEVRDEKTREQIRSSMLATPEHVAVSAMRALADETLYRPDPIKVPMLAVLAKTPFWAADTESFLRSLAPELEFHMLEGVSHFLMMDKPEEFNALLRNFLAKQQARSR